MLVTRMLEHPRVDERGARRPQNPSATRRVYGTLTAPARPLPNDESKRFSEALTEPYQQQYDIDVRTARIFNTYGPRMRPVDGRVIPNFFSQALRGEDLTVTERRHRVSAT